MWLIELVFPLFCKSDMSKYGYVEVFQKVPWKSRYWESTVYSTLPVQLKLGTVITKTRLFKYTENFTAENWKFSDKKLCNFF